MGIRNFFNRKKKELKTNKAWLLIGKVVVNPDPTGLEKYFVIEPQRQMTTGELAQLIRDIEKDLDKILGAKNE